MGLLNLTLLEFLALLLPLSALVVVLYLYDRTRRRRVVSALWLWPQRPEPPPTLRRRTIRQPLSLLLQLLALALLLLSAANLWVGDSRTARHHVVILDTSAWMGSPAGPGVGEGTLLEVAKQRAGEYLAALPAGDPVLLVLAADAPSPSNGFTTDRAVLLEEIEAAEPARTALSLSPSLKLAREAMELALGIGESATLSGPHPAAGEIVYIGPGILSGSDDPEAAATAAPHLRWITVPSELQDVGIRRFTARRDQADPARWDVVLEIHNQTTAEIAAEAAFAFNQRPIGTKPFRLHAGGVRQIEFRLTSARSGRLRAEVPGNDPFPDNNDVEISLPASSRSTVVVHTGSEQRWKPLIEANPLVTAVYHRGAVAAPQTLGGRLTVYDRMVPPAGSLGPAIVVAPVGPGSPRPATATVGNARVVEWADHALTDGLRTGDLLLDRASVLELGPDDLPLASIKEGPVLVLQPRAQGDRLIFGFDPTRGSARHRLATPLLFANALNWFLPQLFRDSHVEAAVPGLIDVALDGDQPTSVRLSPDSDPALTWTSHAGQIRFYSGAAGDVTVESPSRLARYHLTLPEVGSQAWTPPEETLRGVPPVSTSLGPAHLWKWFAFLALLCLAVEWWLYGGRRRDMHPAATPSAPTGSAGPVLFADPPMPEERTLAEAQR